MGFKKILLGLLFLIDYRIEGFDILPDVIGYLIIIIGLTYIAEVNYKFKVARVLALLLLIPSGFSFYQRPTTLSNINVSDPLFVLQLLVLMTTILFAYFLYTGISDLAASKHYWRFETMSNTTWYILFVYHLFAFIGFYLPVLNQAILTTSIIIYFIQLLVLLKSSKAFRYRISYS